VFGFASGGWYEAKRTGEMTTKHRRTAHEKLCLLRHTSTLDQHSARDEFEALQRTHAAMIGCDAFSVPEPHFLHERHGLVAMEWIPGQDMTEWLLSGRSFPAAEQMMHHAAEWLHRFHVADRLPPGRLDVEDKLEQVNGELGDSPLASDPVFSHALQCMRETAADAGTVVLDRCWIHGDFKTDNLNVTGERTIGLDIHARMENAVLYDIAPFLNYLDLKLLHPRAWRLWRCRSQLVEAFLIRYGFDGNDIAMLSLCGVRLFSLLAVWDSAARRQRTMVPALTTRWMFHNAASRAIGDLVRRRLR
jgi:Ser/Thr protein kinase RdoA (MazF antagonist)